MNVPWIASEVLEIELTLPVFNWPNESRAVGDVTRFGLSAEEETQRLIANSTATTPASITHWLRGPRGLALGWSLPPGGGVTRHGGDGPRPLARFGLPLGRVGRVGLLPGRVGPPGPPLGRVGLAVGRDKRGRLGLPRRGPGA